MISVQMGFIMSKNKLEQSEKLKFLTTMKFSSCSKLRSRKVSPSKNGVQTKEEIVSTRAVVTIQAMFRGHKTRVQLKKEHDAAILIQANYRDHRKRRQEKFLPSIEIEQLFDKVKQKDYCEQNISRMGSYSSYLSTDTEDLFQSGSFTTKKLVRQNFKSYQADINELVWQAQVHIESSNMENGKYQPLNILLISTNVRNYEMICYIKKDNIKILIYDFATTNFNTLLQSIQKILSDHKEGCCIKSLGFLCNGGPGYFYLFKGTVVTSAKLKNNPKLKRFFENIGDYMTKLVPCTFDLIVENILKDKSKGTELLTHIQHILQPNRVKIDCSSDISIKDLDVLSKYVCPEGFQKLMKSKI